MERLKILVAEDNVRIADDICHYLRELGHQVIGKAYTAEKARMLALQHTPQIALLDIHLEKHMDGIDLGIWFRKNLPVPVIFLTAYTDSITLQKAKEVHPDFYLVKPFNKLQLKIAIEIVGYNYYHPDTEQQKTMKLFRFCSSLMEPLSEREVDVLKLVEEGLNNRQIAERLFVSKNTVKTHLKNIFVKTTARSRADLLSKLNQA